MFREECSGTNKSTLPKMLRSKLIYFIMGAPEQIWLLEHWSIQHRLCRSALCGTILFVPENSTYNYFSSKYFWRLGKTRMLKYESLRNKLHRWAKCQNRRKCLSHNSNWVQWLFRWYKQPERLSYHSNLTYELWFVCWRWSCALYRKI